MDETQQEIIKIQNLIKNGKDFLIMGHRNVDGDAYGSSMALYLYLQGIHKYAEVVNASPITPLFHFLDIHTEVGSSLKKEKYDAIFVCDCGELSLVGKYPEIAADLFKSTPIINIDHHNGNKMFGNYNLVDTQSSSTCEIVYDLILSGGEFFSPEVATFLLFGIIRDTNCFKNSIRPHTFEVTAKLIERHAAYEKIIFYSYKSEKINYLQIYGYALENLISLKGGTIVGSYISQEIFKRYAIAESELGPQLINEILSSIEGADFAFLIKETAEGNIKLSFRARCEGFDVSRIARHFGGGGHIQSGGAYTDAPIEEILRTIEEMNVRNNL